VAVRASTCAERAENQGGNAPEIVPPIPINANGATQ
jgi:hypothetical protein